MSRSRVWLGLVVIGLGLSGWSRAVAIDSGSGSSPSTGVSSAPAVIAPDLQQGNLLFGQDHAYTVHLRGNGEAIVTARLTVGNQSDKPLSNVSFTAPEAEISDLVGYQQTINSSTANKSLYISDYYSYDKLTFQLIDGRYQVSLPKPIAVGDQAVLLVGYASRYYITKGWLLQKYQFQSLKVSDRIRNLTIGINVDSQLYLNPTNSTINYEATGVAADLPLAAADTKSAALDPIISSIGYGQRVMTASNLAANETYEVSGSVADARWKFYAGWLAGGLLLLLALPFLLWWGLKLLAQGPRATSLLRLISTSAVALADIAAICSLVLGADWLVRQNVSLGGSSFLVLLAGLLTLVVVLVLALGPALWLWLLRHRGQSAILLAGWQVIWLVVIIILYILVIIPQTSNGGIEPVAAL